MSRLLEIRGLEVAFQGPAEGWIPVVRGIDLEVRTGEIVGLVGESGSGKTLTALATLGLVPPPGGVRAGSIRFDGRELVGASETELRRVRGAEIGLAFQEPAAALTPVLTLGRQLVEAVAAHRRLSPSEARDRAVELLRAVALPEPEDRLGEFPHQLSGGQRQRVVLALALAASPRLLLADEPTASLDLTLQARILDALVALRDETGLAILLISHDLALVAERCDRVCVLYAGEIVESGGALELFESPSHPYTRALLATVPGIDHRPEGGRLPTIPGQVPGPGNLPAGCAFHPRCPERAEPCESVRPDWRGLGAGRGVRCLRRGAPGGGDR